MAYNDITPSLLSLQIGYITWVGNFKIKKIFHSFMYFLSIWKYSFPPLHYKELFFDEQLLTFLWSALNWFSSIHVFICVVLGGKQSVLWQQYEDYSVSIREAAKKVLLLMDGPLRPNPPPHSSLMAVGTLERWKKRFQKINFFPNGQALYPPS